jgi:hypothetical protein
VGDGGKVVGGGGSGILGLVGGKLSEQEVVEQSSSRHMPHWRRGA